MNSKRKSKAWRENSEFALLKPAVKFSMNETSQKNSKLEGPSRSPSKRERLPNSNDDRTLSIQPTNVEMTTCSPIMKDHHDSDDRHLSHSTTPLSTNKNYTKENHHATIGITKTPITAETPAAVTTETPAAVTTKKNVTKYDGIENEESRNNKTASATTTTTPSTTSNRLENDDDDDRGSRLTYRRNSLTTLKRPPSTRRNSIGGSHVEHDIVKQRANWVEYLNTHGMSCDINSSKLHTFQKWKRMSTPPSSHENNGIPWRNMLNRASYTMRHKFITWMDAVDHNSRHFSELVRNGIPPEHRGHVWWVCSGGEQKKAKALPHEQYHVVLESTRQTPPPAAPEIEKDLYRTFPNITTFENEEGIANLRHVLGAYSVRNVQVGYCQSMNFIVALLLLHMDEEEAFWVLAAIVEDLLPNYYTECMSGCHTDQRAFMDMIQSKLPQVYTHLTNLKVLLEPLTLKWFLCLFVNTLPLDVTLRIWDCFFHEGSVVLFRAGLSLLYLRSESILKANDAITIYEALRVNDIQLLENLEVERNSHCSIADLLLKACYDRSWIGTISMMKVDAFREEQQQVQQQEPTTTTKNLQNEPRLSTTGSSPTVKYSPTTTKSSPTTMRIQEQSDIENMHEAKDASKQDRNQDRMEYDFVDEFRNNDNDQDFENPEILPIANNDSVRKDSLECLENSCSGYIDLRYSHRFRSLSTYLENSGGLVIENYW